jgi:hypothetical protein
MRRDVATSHILDRLELAIHLTNASKCNSRSSVELTVFDEDVCRVCFWRNAIVTVIHCPSSEGDVIGIDNVRPICITFSCQQDVLEESRSITYTVGAWMIY